MMTQMLSSIDLTETEEKSYLGLLGKGSLTAGALAKDLGMYRKNVYDALYALSQRGLVSYVTKGKRKYWTAISPERISQILDDERAKFSAILPKLMKQYQSSPTSHHVEVLEGKQGVQTFNERILEVGKTLYGIGVKAQIFENFRYSIPRYKRKAKRKRIRGYFLLSSDHDKKGVRRLMATRQARCRKLTTKVDTRVFVFGTYTGIQLGSELVILINSEEISGDFKKYFKALWKNSAEL